MTKLAMAVLAAVTLMQPVLALAGDKSTGSHAAPTSFVPNPQAHSHVYGTPIQPAIVGHAKTSHPKHTSTKHSTSGAKRAQ